MTQSEKQQVRERCLQMALATGTKTAVILVAQAEILYQYLTEGTGPKGTA